MRLLAIGREGQLARSLAERCARAGVAFTHLARPELDLLVPDSVARMIETARGDVVINAAAYTAVDKAESEPDLALRVNGAGAGAVALAAAKTGRPLLHISTDYVFDGLSDRPYREDDPANPVSVYGRTKLAGEYSAAAANPRCVVARSAWIYSPFGHNFLKTMLRLGQTRDEVSVVDDQWGSPTNALDLADALIAMARRLMAEPANENLYGTFHVTGTSYTTWAAFAAAIFAQAAQSGRKPVRVSPISTSQYPTAAKRPANSRLDATKLHRVYGLALPEWLVPAQECVKRLIQPREAERRS
jgi:dTDP-4-dehydrorhamnose reductase